MPPYYDSDSSADEAEDFTETNVLLGYASKDPGDDPTSRLGGRPEWLDAATPPSGALGRCKICKAPMALLLQLNGELPDRFPGHERRLHVFACRRKGCRRRDGSVRALRSVRVAPGSKEAAAAVPQPTKKKDETKATQNGEPPQLPSNLGETLFGAKTLGGASANANPFSSGGGGGGNPFAAGGNPFSSSSKPVETTKPDTTKPETTKPETATETPTTPAITTTDSDGAANPDTSEANTTLPLTFAAALSLNAEPPAPPSPPEPWPPEPEQAKPYAVSYLSEAEYEALDPAPPAPAQNVRMDVDGAAASEGGGGGGGGGQEDREVFESAMDAAFQRFADRVGQNPEQSLRYEFAGSPLLYSTSDRVGKLLSPPSSSSSPSSKITTTTTTGKGNAGIPRCPACAAPRVFEVQLTPQAIAELEADDEGVEEAQLDAGMDWGTVIVGVCARDCQARGVAEGAVGYLEEWVGVQWEELTGVGGRR
ncbi:programmed cell death protein 2 [Xylariomycetidae sp. FL0641]|nr:programmed cell death protein 2 [Xylariomycetidae sp. FL0641]